MSAESHAGLPHQVRSQWHWKLLRQEPRVATAARRSELRRVAAPRPQSAAAHKQSRELSLLQASSDAGMLQTGHGFLRVLSSSCVPSLAEARPRTGTGLGRASVLCASSKMMTAFCQRSIFSPARVCASTCRRAGRVRVAVPRTDVRRSMGSMHGHAAGGGRAWVGTGDARHVLQGRAWGLHARDLR
jgi:hypothetical protein